MEDLAKLVKELTDLAITARTYLNLRAVKEGLIAAPADNATLPAPKTKKTAEKKAEKEPEAAPVKEGSDKKTVAAALGAGEPTMSEKESLDVAFKLAAAYIQKDGAEKQAANKEALRAYIKKAYNATQVSAIAHKDRIEFIEWLKAETAPKADQELVS